jgi:hypothetical protein
LQAIPATKLALLPTVSRDARKYVWLGEQKILLQ